MRKFLILLFLIALATPAWASSLTYKETLGGSGTTGTIITAHANANTKGSYTSLGTSTAASAYVSIVIDTPEQAKAYLVDVAADQAGGTTYVPFVQNIPIEGANTTSTVWQSVVIPIPMVFASGTQFAARCQSDTGSATVKVHLVSYTGSTPFTVTFVETFGADTATSKGQEVDPGGSGNTKGAYSQLVASSAGAADYLIPVVLPQTAQATIVSSYIWIDISTGAAASEVVKLGNAFVMEDSNEIRLYTGGPREVDIASGVRVAARAQSTNTTVDRREFDVAVVAFVKSVPATATGGTGRVTCN
jgi:hypothetical protein